MAVVLSLVVNIKCRMGTVRPWATIDAITRNQTIGRMAALVQSMVTMEA
jgi:hypothetical protein